jgi:hypothetical protein
MVFEAVLRIDGVDKAFHSAADCPYLCTQLKSALAGYIFSGKCAQHHVTCIDQ